MARTLATGFQILDDSVTGDDVKEETLEDFKIPFIESDFTANNVHDAIIEAKEYQLLYGVLDRDVVIPVDMGMTMVSPYTGNHMITILGTLVIL